MEEISTIQKKLPQTVEEKTAFVLFGPDALNAYRKKLKAVKEKFGISSEQYKQIQLEAQETAENLLLFSVDIGEEMGKIETYEGKRTDLQPHDVNDKRLTKSQTIHAMGFTDRQARDFQTLANHPDAVKQAMEDARAEGRIVTRQDVLKEIKSECYPDKYQQARKDFQDAKKRNAEYEEQKAEGVVNLNAAKQNKEDREKLFESFQSSFIDMHNQIKLFGAMAEDGNFRKKLGYGDKYAIRDIATKLGNDLRTIMKLQRIAEEVNDEKQR